jgi:hypothetical protein
VLAREIRILTRVPFTIQAALTESGWRDALVWPLAPARRAAISEGAVAALRDWRRSLVAGPARDAADLASLHLLTIGARASLYAHEQAAAAEAGLTLVGARPELAALRDGTPLPAPRREFFDAPRRSRIPFARTLRAIRNARRWTPLHRLARVVLAPDAHVLSTGGLLIEAATGHSLSYASPGELLGRARAAGAAKRIDAAALAAGWAAHLVAALDIPDSARARMTDLVRAQSEPALTRADCDLAGLAAASNMPANAWAGSAGSYATRAIGIEILRRGGYVRRFAHGGAIGLDDYGATHSLVDMAAASHYTVATRGVLSSLVESGIDAKFDGAAPNFDAAAGDPKFRSVARRGRARPAGRPTVLYVGTAFAGPLVHVPPVPPDAIYFDWQCRLMDALGALAADVWCKPHPENTVLSGTQPLPALYRAMDAPFGEALARADVVVFDYALSTSFWEALCSDRPVVLMDLAGTRWRPKIGAMIARRCVRVDVAYDTRNRPVFDADRLADAVASARPADPDEFRRLLAGDA